MLRGALTMCAAPSAGAMERFVEEKAGRRVRVAALDCPSVPSLLLLPGSRVGGARLRGPSTLASTACTAQKGPGDAQCVLEYL